MLVGNCLNDVTSIMEYYAAIKNESCLHANMKIFLMYIVKRKNQDVEQCL